MVAAFISGHLLARAGGYSRNLSIIGMTITCVGMFLLSLVAAGSAYWLVVVYTIFVGFGIGFSITVFTSIIQNVVPNNQLGVSTSSNTFIRSFGGAVGLAVLGSIVNNRFITTFIDQVPETAKSAISLEKLTSLARDPQALVNPAAQAQLRDTLISPSSGTAIFDQVMQGLHQALSSAIAECFLIGFGILVIGLIATLFLKKKPYQNDGGQIQSKQI
jgi:hypothetical protein